ncbi:hypothetical protein EDEG_01679 [Edhazardia aedis USNM 41457]|uniref:Uncharacterized protein n=1 Tax=Edhazardia aedis (strain USNM 41457) TaxID=1003232 RepID=J9DNE8_EDHAE|nr:hypothetical protein EDEG_01679 [Edhazardia aedis USNM 41457]|eukprot:EJW04045.1 hypothetical protein EDEG_01679 [Edhazardia aedis USNM 41457]
MTFGIDHIKYLNQFFKTQKLNIKKRYINLLYLQTRMYFFCFVSLAHATLHEEIDNEIESSSDPNTVSSSSMRQENPQVDDMCSTHRKPKAQCETSDEFDNFTAKKTEEQLKNISITLKNTETKVVEENKKLLAIAERNTMLKLRENSLENSMKELEESKREKEKKLKSNERMKKMLEVQMTEIKENMKDIEKKSSVKPEEMVKDEKKYMEILENGTNLKEEFIRFSKIDNQMIKKLPVLKNFENAEKNNELLLNEEMFKIEKELEILQKTKNEIKEKLKIIQEEQDKMANELFEIKHERDKLSEESNAIEEKLATILQQKEFLYSTKANLEFTWNALKKVNHNTEVVDVQSKEDAIEHK